MNENVKKILEIFSNLKVLSILESPTNYIVSVCPNNADTNETVENLFAVDKTTFESSEFSYFEKPDEYAVACDNVLYKYDEITHWGVRGMKWGIRRYQNKDGTLTKAGKKRYNAELAKVREQEKTVKNKTAVKNRLDKLAARQKAVADKNKELDGEKKKLFGKKKTDEEVAEQAKPKKKKMSEMSDEELALAIRRAQMEKQYKDLTAEERAKGEGFTKRFMKESVEPAVKDAGRTLIRDKLLDVGKKKLGLADLPGGDDGMAALNKEIKQLQLQQLRQKVEKEAISAAQKTSETKAAKEHEKVVAEVKEDIKTSIDNFKSSVSSGEKTAVKYYRTPTSTVTTPENVSAGESFVGRYDRAAIAAMDDE